MRREINIERIIGRIANFVLEKCSKCDDCYSDHEKSKKQETKLKIRIFVLWADEAELFAK